MVTVNLYKKKFDLQDEKSREILQDLATKIDQVQDKETRQDLKSSLLADLMEAKKLDHQQLQKIASNIGPIPEPKRIFSKVLSLIALGFYSLIALAVLPLSIVLLSLWASEPELRNLSFLLTALGTVVLPGFMLLWSIVLFGKQRYGLVTKLFLAAFLPLFMIAIIKLVIPNFENEQLNIFLAVTTVTGLAYIAIQLIGDTGYGAKSQIHIAAKALVNGLATSISGYVLAIWSVGVATIVAGSIIELTKNLNNLSINTNIYYMPDITASFMGLVFLLIFIIFFLLIPVYAFIVYAYDTYKSLRYIYRWGYGLHNYALLAAGIALMPILVIIFTVTQFNPDLAKYKELDRAYTEGDFTALEKVIGDFSEADKQDLARMMVVQRIYLLDNTVRRDYGNIDTIINKYSIATLEVLAPFLTYKGSFADGRLASRVYSIAFDADINAEQADYINWVNSNSSYEGLFDFGSRTGGAATALDIKAQKVVLEEFFTTVATQGDGLQTTLDFKFLSNSNLEEEAVIVFNLPENSVVTDLKLGQYLQNQGVVAPRAAAQRVYQASINRRTDPALLEQIGPRTFRLRVYPIFPRGSGNPDWQRVQVKFESDGSAGLVKFEQVRNLAISNTRVKLDLKNKSQELAVSNLFEYNQIARPAYNRDLQVYIQAGKQRKYSLLIDSSFSASVFKEESKAKAIEFTRKLAAEGYEVTVYTYSYKVDRLGDSGDLAALEAKISGLEYRGPSVSDKLVKFINSKDLLNQQIILFRDDSEHDLKEFRSAKQVSLDIVQLGDANLHVYDMGEQFNSLPQELLLLNLAGGGQVFNGGVELQSNTPTAKSFTTGSKFAKLSELNAKLKGLQASNRSALAIEIFKAGKQEGILAPFTAYIALETDWQKVMLNNLTDDFTNNNSQQPGSAEEINIDQISFPESADYKLVLMLGLICSVLLLVARRQQKVQEKIL